MKNNLFLFGAVVTAAISFSESARAVPTGIDGTISFVGTTTTDTGNFLTATKFTSFMDTSVGAPNALYGDYIGTSGAVVTMTPFTFDPGNASTPVTPLWTFVSGGDTYSLDLNSFTVDFRSATAIALSGFGTAHITGPGVDKIDTSAFWNFTAQTWGVSGFTFSSTDSSPDAPPNLPDGASTLILLGGACLGMGLFAKQHSASLNVPAGCVNG